MIDGFPTLPCPPVSQPWCTLFPLPVLSSHSPFRSPCKTLSSEKPVLTPAAPRPLPLSTWHPSVFQFLLFPASLQALSPTKMEPFLIHPIRFETLFEMNSPWPNPSPLCAIALRCCEENRQEAEAGAPSASDTCRCNGPPGVWDPGRYVRHMQPSGLGQVPLLSVPFHYQRNGGKKKSRA